jgi:hypothetical protein
MSSCRLARLVSVDMATKLPMTGERIGASGYQRTWPRAVS